MATFPYLGSYSGTDETDFEGIIRDYADNSEREYYKSPAKKRTITVPFTNISKTKRDAIEAFYVANKKLDITLYVWPEATAVGTGPSHTARIRGPLVFTNNSSCSYSCSLTFKLKN
jgi:hypothetical protein